MAADDLRISSGWDAHVSNKLTETLPEERFRSTSLADNERGAYPTGTSQTSYQRSELDLSVNTDRLELGPFVSADTDNVGKPGEFHIDSNDFTEFSDINNGKNNSESFLSNHTSVPRLEFLPDPISVSEDSLLAALDEYDLNVNKTSESGTSVHHIPPLVYGLRNMDDTDISDRRNTNGHLVELQNNCSTNRSEEMLNTNDTVGGYPRGSSVGNEERHVTDLERSNVIQSNERHSSDWHCHRDVRPGLDKLARNQLIAVCTLCTTFMIGEAIGGVLSNSLALFTDVLHLASDLISFLISLLAIYLSTKPATKTMSFGYHRAEVLGALFSVFIIWMVTGVLCYMAVERITKEHYKDVKADEMVITASLGVVFNIVMGIALHSEKCCGSASARASFGHGHSHGGGHSHGQSHKHSSHLLNQNDEALEHLLQNEADHEQEMISPVKHVSHKHTKHKTHKNLNVRAAFIHVIGDIIQSVGVLIASLIIKLKPEDNYKIADPICTFVFSILVLFTTSTVLRDTLRIMMEGVPRDLNYSDVIRDLESIQGVKTIHSLSIWTLTIDKNALAVHITIDSSASHQKILETASTVLKNKYEFLHTTIQVETYVPAIMDICENGCKPL